MREESENKFMPPNTGEVQEKLGHIADQIEEAGYQMNLLASKGFSGEIVSVVRNWMSSKECSLIDRGFTLAYRLAPNELPELVPEILNWIDSDRYHPQTFRDCSKSVGGGLVRGFACRGVLVDRR